MKQQTISTTGEVLANGKIIEMVYNKDESNTSFAINEKGIITLHSQYKDGQNCYKPYSANNRIINSGIVLLPSEAMEYQSVHQLACQLRYFINTYVDLDPIFENLCVHYILLSWVYDSFNQLPYLRKCGDYGTGKTRFLTVIGSLCYKPIFASGSSSTPALFHILDKFRGTLILDEADFRYSDEKADLTKVLNNGFTKGYPVLRCSFNKNKEFDPIGYQVYGCKLIAARKHFKDPALESRFITERINYAPPREEIPIELPDSFESEALTLRNKLLMFRFNNLSKGYSKAFTAQLDGLEPRVRQIFLPLLELAVDERSKNQFAGLAHQYHKQLIKERAASIEYHVLSSISKLLKYAQKISIGDITNTVIADYADFHDRRITAKWVGYVVSKSLCLKSYKTGGRFYLNVNQQKTLKTLYRRYGVE